MTGRMRGGRRVGGLLGVGLALLLALSGCASSAGTSPAVSDLYDGDVEVSMPLPDERAPGVPDECFEHYPWATGPASFDALELTPDGWPEPPQGSTLCTTNSGGAAETAIYVTTQPADEVLAHYEAALGAYEHTRITGAENGTGYDSLDGSDGGAFNFQIREAEGGFQITFIDTEAFNG